ncbi:MAG: alpha/beta hydrolase [Bacillota bacterium]
MPIVVFEHGVATPGLIWGLVYPEISKMTRTIIYDRAGYGWSDPGPTPRTSQKCAEELYRLLQALKIQEPVILVGHSFGSINIRLFAHLYPTHIVGLVLVDPVHEAEFSNRFPPQHQEQRYLEAKIMLMVKYLIKLKLMYLLVKLRLVPEFFSIAKKFPSGIKNILCDITFKFTAFDSAYSELLSFTRGDNVQHIELPDGLPVIVIKAANFNQYKKGISQETKEQINRSLHEVAQELSLLSESGEFSVVKDSGHLIHVDQPQIVVEKIQKLLYMTRKQ